MVEPIVAPAKIAIEGVTKSYDLVLALARTDLALPEGSFTCLLGPSGCGKSTLLNMIAGFALPTSGAIRVDGAMVTGPGANRGMVFQEYALFPWRSVLDNVAFGPMLQGRPRAECIDIAHRYLRLVGLSDRAAAFPSKLSGGMKQRVAIARALANDPSVLLMDEPFGALDAQTRETLQEELLAISQVERKTVVFVTHSITEAIYLGDRVVVMSAQPGAVRKIYDITLPHERDRTGAEFVELEREIHVLMRAEVSKLGRI